MMKIEDVTDKINIDDYNSSIAVSYMEEKYKGLPAIPDIMKHKPSSKYGSCYLACLGKNSKRSKVFCWVSPVYDGTYKFNPPYLKITYL